MPGGRDLKNDIINNSLCTLCGACLDWCPYIKNLEDNLVITFDCNVNDGHCYSVCPRTYTNWKQVNHQFLEEGDWTQELGSFKKIYMVKNTEPLPRQQDGGTVSALMISALENKAVQALLLTGSREFLEPEAFIGRNLSDVKTAAGSKFLAATGLRKIHEASEQGIQSLLVVGRPCQIQALRKMQLNQPKQLENMEIYTIGLFCMWSLSWEFMNYLQNEYPGLRVKSMAIPRHGAEIMIDEGIKSIPIEKVREYIRPGCRYCLDMTSELADVSIGACEANPGWNTLIVRTERGITMVQQAAESGLLQVKDYPEDEFQRLKQASVNKKARNWQLLKELIATGTVKTPVELSHYEYLQEVNS